MSPRSVFLAFAFCIAVVMLLLLAGERSTTSGDSVRLSLHVDGCTCSQYNDFDLTWAERDTARINQTALIQALFAADSSGAFLCDCRNEDGEAYTAVVATITPRNDNLGLKIVLAQTVWLYYDDVRDKLNEALKDKQRAIFDTHQFKVI